MKNIRLLRVMNGKSLSEVADAIGISRQRYFQIENTGNGSANEEILRKIAAYYGFGFFEFLGKDALRFQPRNEAEKKEILKHVTREE